MQNSTVFYIIPIRCAVYLLVSDLTPQSEKKARLTQQMHALETRFRAFFERHGNRAVLLLPAYPTRPPLHRVKYVCAFDPLYTGLFNGLGLPSTIAPVGLHRERNVAADLLGVSGPPLPMSVQIVGPHMGDALTIRVAMELEAHLGGWVPPGGKY